MTKELKDLINVINPEKLIFVTHIDMYGWGDYAMIAFTMDGKGSEKMSGSMPVLKSKLSSFLEGTAVKKALEVIKEPVKATVKKEEPVAAKEEPKKRTRRIKCPKTGEYISKEEFRANNAAGKYKNML